MNKQETKVAYISGPISGLQNGNSEAFFKAQKDLEKQGYIVVNPHEIGKELYNKWSTININTKELVEESWQDFMKNDIRHLTLCHVLFALEGWETSKGSKIEVYLANKLGIKIYSFKDFTEINIDLHLVPGRLLV